MKILAKEDNTGIPEANFRRKTTVIFRHRTSSGSATNNNKDKDEKAWIKIWMKK
jgi:hypothetical protein